MPRRLRTRGENRIRGVRLPVLGSRTTILADRGSTAAGGNIIITGIPFEQLPAILKAATDPLERLNAAQLVTITRLERELGASQEQVFGFFRILGEADVQPEAI